MAVLAVACGKQQEEPARTDRPAAPAPPSEPAPPPARRPPAPPAAPPPAIDCATLVTPADVARACGGAKVEIAASTMEGKTPLTTCTRTLTAPGKRFPIGHVQLSVHANGNAAESFMKLEKSEESTPLADIGERGWATQHEVPDLKTTMFTVVAQQGRFTLAVKSDRNSLNPKPPCTLEQMTALLKIAIARLP